METNPSPERLREMIDEALAEIEQIESDVIELFEGIGGPDLVQKLFVYAENAKRAPGTAALRGVIADEAATPEASRGSSTERPATP